MEGQVFVGWVEKILEATEFEQKVVVSNFRDETMKEQMKHSKDTWPCSLMFSLSTKGCNEQLQGICEGDKVQVKYFVSGKCGISKKTQAFYCINSLNVAKNGGFILLERGGRTATGADAEEDDNTPF